MTPMHQSTSSGGGSAGTSGSANPECRTFCSNIGYDMNLENPDNPGAALHILEERRVVGTLFSLNSYFP